MGITPQQFAQMQERVRGGASAAGTARARARPRPSQVHEPARASAPSTHEVILGIDPSLRGTGYGIIRWRQRRAELLAHGTIKSASTWARSRCLLHIHQHLRSVLQEHRPTVCVVESLFYAQNLQTALIMGEARGAGLVAIAEAGLEIFEIAPRKVKQAIVGYGAAQKTAVAKMVQRLLQLAEPPAPDAADALALALVFAHENGRYGLTPQRRV